MSVREVAAAAGAAAPPTSSGTKVPTTAVLTTPAQKRAKALFCSTAPAWLRSSGDDSKAAHLRQPLLSRHWPSMPRSFFLSLIKQSCLSRKRWAELACLLGRRPRNGAQAGAFERN